MSYSLVELCSEELINNNENFDKIRYMAIKERRGPIVVIDIAEIPTNIKEYRMDAYHAQEKPCEACLFYTLDYIYFSVVYDGFYHVSSVPRNHDDLGEWKVTTYGGGSGSTDKG